MRSRLAIALPLLLSTAATPCFADDNPLLGTWTLTQGDRGGCYSPISFTATTQTLNMAGQKPSVTHVTYNASPQKVYVMGNTGISGAVGYIIVDRNHIKLDSWAQCSWTRR